MNVILTRMAGIFKKMVGAGIIKFGQKTKFMDQQHFFVVAINVS